MRLLESSVDEELPGLVENNVRLRTIGDLASLDQGVRRSVERAARATEGNTGLTLLIALNYGGRRELVRAVRTLADDVARGALAPAAIDEASVAAALDTAGVPDPTFSSGRAASTGCRTSCSGRWRTRSFSSCRPSGPTSLPGTSTAPSRSTSAVLDGSGACKRRPIRRVTEPVLAQRLLSALVGIPVLIALVVWGPAWLFTAVVLLFAIGAQLELYRMFAGAGVEADRAAGLALGALVVLAFGADRPVLLPLALSLAVIVVVALGLRRDAVVGARVDRGDADAPRRLLLRVAARARHLAPRAAGRADADAVGARGDVVRRVGGVLRGAALRPSSAGAARVAGEDDRGRSGAADRVRGDGDRGGAARRAARSRRRPPSASSWAPSGRSAT